jgi:hypothetical protein
LVARKAAILARIETWVPRKAAILARIETWVPRKAAILGRIETWVPRKAAILSRIETWVTRKAAILGRMEISVAMRLLAIESLKEAEVHEARSGGWDSATFSSTSICRSITVGSTTRSRRISETSKRSPPACPDFCNSPTGSPSSPAPATT